MKSASFYTVLLICCCIIGFNLFSIPQNILSWDVFGYYLYLPQLIIHHNLLNLHDAGSIQHIIDTYHNTGTLYQCYPTETGTWIMRYTMGLSLLYLPFFIIGHCIALIVHYPADGFSLPYQYSILAGGIVYSIAGIIYLRKILLHYFDDLVSSIVLIAVFFGTNYFFHVAFNGSNAMSHNYLFSIYCFIIWHTIKWHETFKLKHICWLGMWCGLAVLARPSELIGLLIPLLWNVTDKKSLKAKIKLLSDYRTQLILLFILVGAIGSIQLIYWKIITGHFIFDSYGTSGGEGFEFLHPYVWQVLFSFRKGWLLYTPVMLFSILGMYFLYRKNTAIFISLTVFLCINLYIISSWSCWWYAESFSQRSLIQSYGLLALPLGYFIDASRKFKIYLRISFYSLLFLLIAFNLFQTWQADKGILDFSRMSKQYYQAIFLKTHVPKNAEQLLMVNRSTNGEEKFNHEGYIKTKEMRALFSGLDDKLLYKQLDSNCTFSKAVESTYADLTKKDHIWLHVTMHIKPLTDPTKNPGSLVVQFEHNGVAYKYKALDAEKLNLKMNEWNNIELDYLSPEVRNVNDKLKVYYWLRGKQPVLIGPTLIEVWERRF